MYTVVNVEKTRGYSVARGATAGVLAVVIGGGLAGCMSKSGGVVSGESGPAPSATSSMEMNGRQLISTAEAVRDLGTLAVKGRAPMTGYSREQFGGGWATVGGCDERDNILRRDLTGEKLDSHGCKVLSGVLQDPYTGKRISFTRGVRTSGAVQIDHVVALGDAWQTGAQQLSAAQREKLANDPLELNAVDGPANEQKGDGDAATWLPSNKSIRCAYVAQQILVKERYDLWVTSAEHNAMQHVLAACPGQQLAVPVG